MPLCCDFQIEYQEITAQTSARAYQFEGFGLG